MSERQQGKSVENGTVLQLLANNITAFLAVGGILVYSLQSFSTNNFYVALGVSPNDVGISFASTLASSAGFAIIALLVTTVLGLFGYVLARVLARYGPRAFRNVSKPSVILSVVAVLSYIVTAVIASYNANDVAATVQRGGGGEAGRYGALIINPKPMYFAAVKPVSKPEEEPAAIRELEGHNVVYLGQANGTVVLYDSIADRAVYLPASSVVIEVVNCGVGVKPIDLVTRYNPLKYCRVSKPY